MIIAYGKFLMVSVARSSLRAGIVSISLHWRLGLQSRLKRDAIIESSKSKDMGIYCGLSFLGNAEPPRNTEFRDQQRMHKELRAPLPEDRHSDLAKDGKHQVSVMNWVKDIEAEVKTRGLDTMFCIDLNIRNFGNPGHAAQFVSIFTHFGKLSIKDTEDYVANITRDGGGGIIDADAKRNYTE